MAAHPLACSQFVRRYVTLIAESSKKNPAEAGCGNALAVRSIALAPRPVRTPDVPVNTRASSAMALLCDARKRKGQGSVTGLGWGNQESHETITEGQ